MVKGEQMSKAIIFFLFVSCAFAQDKVIYKYKKRESIDLGELSIKGNVVSPGDLSAKNRDTRKVKFNIPVRKHFDDFAVENIDSSF